MGDCLHVPDNLTHSMIVQAQFFQVSFPKETWEGKAFSLALQVKTEFNLAPFTSTQLVSNSRTEKNKLIDQQSLRTSLVLCHQKEVRGIRLQTVLLQASKVLLCQHFSHGTPFVLIKRANTVTARKTVDLNACTKRISSKIHTHKTTELTHRHRHTDYTTKLSSPHKR